MNKKGRTGLIVGTVLMLLLVIAQANAFQTLDKIKVKETAVSCLDCHRQRNINTNEGIVAANAFCMECHGEKDCHHIVDKIQVSLMVPKTAFEKNPHQYIACIKCHTDVARSPHQSMEGVRCIECHYVHGEGEKVHAPHLKVNCEACHFESKYAALDVVTGRVRLSKKDEKGKPLSLADHKILDPDDEGMCAKCHFEGNPAGAPATALPQKSFLCIVCHNAPLSMGHWMFWPAFLISIYGFFALASFWMKGGVGEKASSAHDKMAVLSENIWKIFFSHRFFDILRILIFDVILQRRILKESVRRWTIHSLIYLAFLSRFGLSLFTLIVYSVSPDSKLALVLINKNHWFVAFTNDFLGMCIILGILWAAILRFVIKPAHVLSKEQDNAALVIVGLLTITGFILEGSRMLVTQVPVEIAAYAFCGYLVSKILSVLPGSWQRLYGYLWFFHASIWAICIAYLPFGKLKHMVTTPLSIIVGADTEKE